MRCIEQLGGWGCTMLLRQNGIMDGGTLDALRCWTEENSSFRLSRLDNPLKWSLQLASGNQMEQWPIKEPKPCVLPSALDANLGKQAMYTLGPEYGSRSYKKTSLVHPGVRIVESCYIYFNKIVVRFQARRFDAKEPNMSLNLSWVLSTNLGLYIQRGHVLSRQVNSLYVKPIYINHVVGNIYV